MEPRVIFSLSNLSLYLLCFSLGEAPPAGSCRKGSSKVFIVHDSRALTDIDTALGSTGGPRRQPVLLRSCLPGPAVVALADRTWRSPGLRGVSVFVLVLGEGTREFIYTAAVNGRLHHAPRCLPCLPTLGLAHYALFVTEIHLLSLSPDLEDLEHPKSI